MSLAGKWVTLEDNMLSEINQRKTSIACFLSYVETSRKKTVTRTKQKKKTHLKVEQE
jgi:hypothetical protein